MNKLKKLKFLWLILCLSVILTACRDNTEQTGGDVATEIKEPETKIVSMVVLGDNLMHMPVVNDGKQPDGSYDYS